MRYQKTKIIIPLLLCLGSLKAQETVSATGGEVSGVGGTSSFSIGQVVYVTAVGSNGSVSEGVEQPYEISIITELKENKEIFIDLIAYPNPTVDVLNIDIKSYNEDNLNYQVYDLTGKMIQSNSIHQKITSINFQELPKATYFLKIIKNETSIKTFKIIKN